MDNVTSITYSDATPPVSLTYDSFGRVTSRADGAGTSGFDYDLNSRVTIVNGPWAGDNVSYTYNDLGMVNSVTPEDGQTVLYTYDGLGRTETVQWGTDTFTYIYNGASPLVTGLERPNGGSTEYLYDGQLKRLTDVINKEDTSTVINSFGYTYNNMDLKADETITRGAPIASMTERLITYTYNNVNQVTDSTNPARTYMHDDDGGMTQGYTPDGYPFDASYDAEGRLVSVEYIDSGSVLHRTEYTYGGDGLLYEIRKFEDGTPTDTTRIIRAGFLPIQERDGNNNVVREYVWGPSMGGGIGGLLAMKENGSTYYYLYDGKGNVMALTDSSGNVVATYTYDPFGVLTEETGTLDQPFRFSTKRYDEQTGLSYYGYRFYSASLGRWMTRDPLGEAGGINLYGFVGNSPINGVDPLGLDVIGPIDIPKGISNNTNSTEGDLTLQVISDFSAGFGDTITFTGTKKIREYWERNISGFEDPVDECSGWYKGGEVSGYAWGVAFGLAGGIRAAGTKAAGKEFSHFIPKRSGGPRSILNGNYVSIAKHALSDPYRYRFMSKVWKSANPLPNAYNRFLVRLPKVWTGTIGGGAYGGTSIAVNN